MANNHQLRHPSELGARDRVDGGVLQVSVLRARTGAALARVVAQAAGRASRGTGRAQWEPTALRVDSQLPQLPAGIDGKTVVLSTAGERQRLQKASFR